MRGNIFTELLRPNALLPRGGLFVTPRYRPANLTSATHPFSVRPRLQLATRCTQIQRRSYIEPTKRCYRPSSTAYKNLKNFDWDKYMEVYWIRPINHLRIFVRFIVYFNVFVKLLIDGLDGFFGQDGYKMWIEWDEYGSRMLRHIAMRLLKQEPKGQRLDSFTIEAMAREFCWTGHRLDCGIFGLWDR